MRVLDYRLSVACLALAAVAAVASTAGAAPERHVVARIGSLTLTPNHVHRGGLVRMRGSARGCPAGDTVSLLSRAFPRVHEFAGVPAVLTKVRADGRFAAATRIPRTRRPGRYGVTGRCGGGNLGFDVPLTVLR